MNVQIKYTNAGTSHETHEIICNTNADIPVHYPQLVHVQLTNAVKKLFESWLMVLYELYRLPF